MAEIAEKNHLCKCNKTCPVCGGEKEEEVTMANGSFWDLWFQKLFRNIASVKYQWLAALAIPTFWAMFTGEWYMPEGAKPEFIPMLDHTIGYTFLGGGFITLATTRIIARTKLVEPREEILDTDK